MPWWHETFIFFKYIKNVTYKKFYVILTHQTQLGLLNVNDFSSVVQVESYAVLFCKNILFNVTLTHEYWNSSVRIQRTETSVTLVLGVFIPELVS